MPDEFKINESLGIIEIRSSGIVSKEDIFNSIQKSRQAYAEIGISKIFVDTTKQEKMPGTVDLFNLFANFPREFALALLATKNQVTVEDILFAENVAVNRGVQMKIFYDSDKAVEWLKQW